MEFIGLGFKSHSGQLSRATSKKLSVMHTISYLQIEEYGKEIALVKLFSQLVSVVASFKGYAEFGI